MCLILREDVWLGRGVYGIPEIDDLVRFVCCKMNVVFVKERERLW